MKFDFQIKYKVILFFVFLVTILAILFVFMDNLSFSSGEPSFAKIKKEKMYPSSPITQNFVAERDNLEQIKVALSSPNLSSDDTINLAITDQFCDKVFGKKIITRHTPHQPLFYLINFPEIKDSAGKKFCFTAIYETDKEDTRSADLPQILASEIDSFSYSKDKRGQGKMKTGSLVMRPSYGNESAYEELKELNQRLSQYKPWFFKKYYWPIIIILFLVLTVTLGTILILL